MFVTMKSVSKSRIYSTIILWAIVAASVISGKAWMLIALITTVIGLGFWEYTSLHCRAGFRLGWRTGVILAIAYPAALWAYYAQYWGRGVGSIEMPADFDMLFLLVAFGVFFSQRMKNSFKPKKTYRIVAANFMGLFYVAFLFSFLIKILFLFPGDDRSEMPGVWYMFWVVLVTKFSDVGALLVGTFFGKDKLIPRISPGKTWQGVFGALLFGVAFGVGDYAIFSNRLTAFDGYWQVAAFACVISIIGIVGDLAESLLKRSVKIKDSSQVLPGIGGILDLIDSLCFTAPVMFYVSKYFLI